MSPHREPAMQIPDDATASDLKEVLRRLEEQGKVRGVDVNTELAAVKASRVQVARDAGAASTEMPPETRVSLTDAQKGLERRANVEAIFQEAMRVHTLWGLPRALTEAGVITNESQYEELLRTATTRESDLPRIKAAHESGNRPTALIVPPLSEKFGLVQLWNTLFSNLPYWQGTYALNNLGGMRRLDPHDIPQLQGLKDRSDSDREKVRKVWAEMYKQKAKPIASGAQLLFTPDQREVTKFGQSALKDMQAGLKGERYLDPAAHWLYLISQLTRGLGYAGSSSEDFRNRLSASFEDRSIDPYIPDTQKITRYSDHVLPDGSVPYFLWSQDPAHRKFLLFGYDPACAYDSLGSRSVLG